jgi:homoserine dehydrogenase
MEMILDHEALFRRELGLELRHAALGEFDGVAARAEYLETRELRSLVDARKKGEPLNSLSFFEGGADSSTLGAWALSESLSNPVMLDLTASYDTYDPMVQLLEGGGKATMSNKRPLVVPMARYERLVAASRPRRLRYDATVGAGIPVTTTLSTLLNTGDRALDIEGCFSGTLGYICTLLDEGKRFSEAVREAKEIGYTEPDPRDDLGGIDVARKALILARTSGQKLNLEDVSLEALIPDEMNDLSLEDFMGELEALDDEYLARAKEARAKGHVLRYVARVDENGCKVGLTSLPRGSRIGSLQGPDNIVVLRTERYRENPITIIGPGAGLEVTATFVLGDILALA